ncbi:hypothetical protein [Psychromonas aquimarina]|uniref:hypothetical protein n=1 Tax=Psychromonas aquimarina TaxID=444919 RepID=UPI0003FC3093|nr:hypothetical protein [Psychromonas aquimarina]
MSDIENIIEKTKATDNYSPEAWEERGLNISEPEVVKLLNETTIEFLDKLKTVANSEDDIEQRFSEVNELVDDLPWDDFDTEEREFLADVLVPPIESLGLDPWDMF